MSERFEEFLFDVVLITGSFMAGHLVGVVVASW